MGSCDLRRWLAGDRCARASCSPTGRDDRPSPRSSSHPTAFGGELRAPVVAAAIARGLERAGVTPPPELCPVSSGGRGTIEALLPALGGETGDGFALIEDGGTAIVELDRVGAR